MSLRIWEQSRTYIWRTRSGWKVHNYLHSSDFTKLFCDFTFIARSGKCHVMFSFTGCAPHTKHTWSIRPWYQSTFTCSVVAVCRFAEVLSSVSTKADEIHQFEESYIKNSYLKLLAILHWMLLVRNRGTDSTLLTNSFITMWCYIISMPSYQSASHKSEEYHVFFWL